MLEKPNGCLTQINAKWFDEVDPATVARGATSANNLAENTSQIVALALPVDASAGDAEAFKET